jgi:transketolase
LYTTIPRPIDRPGLRAAVVGTDLVVIEPYLEGTSVHQLTSTLSDRPMRIRSIGVEDPELAHYGTPEELRAAHGLDAVGIRRALDRLLPPLPV